jgi:pimeloyl-ACP methyl ester carboxylesterase
MRVAKQYFSKLPRYTQDRIVGWLIRSGLIFRMPVFGMMLRSFEYFGADPMEVRNGLARARDGGRSLVAAWRALGGEIGHLARVVEESGDQEVSRDLYFRAALYYLAADWFTYDREDSVWNYALALPCFDRFRLMTIPPIQKIEFPYPVGAIMGHFRVPDVGAGPFPAIVMLQGEDTVKEWMASFEELALARGIATLTIDQPGWGESGLTGNKWISGRDLENSAQLAVDFLRREPEIDGDALGIFGVSLGGLLALYCAGLESRFVAVAGLGGTYHARKVWGESPILFRDRVLRITGLKKAEELEGFFDRLQFEKALSRVRCPALIVHGDQDERVVPDNATALVSAIGGDATVKIVEGGDHLCTQSLFTWVADYIFDWFAQRLCQNIKELDRCRHRMPPRDETSSHNRSLGSLGHPGIQQAI